MLTDTINKFYENYFFHSIKKQKIKREFRKCMNEISIDCLFGDNINGTFDNIKRAYKMLKCATKFNEFYRHETKPIDTERMDKAFARAEMLIDEAYWMQMMRKSGPQNQED